MQNKGSYLQEGTAVAGAWTTRLPGQRAARQRWFGPATSRPGGAPGGALPGEVVPEDPGPEAYSSASDCIPDVSLMDPRECSGLRHQSLQKRENACKSPSSTVKGLGCMHYHYGILRTSRANCVANC